MLIFLFKNNTWLIVLGLRQLLRWETSSPAFEKSLSEDTTQGCIRNAQHSRQLRFSLWGTFCLSRSSPVPLSVLDFPSVRSVTPLTPTAPPRNRLQYHSSKQSNNHAQLCSFNASHSITHCATLGLIVIFTAPATCFNDRSSSTEKSFLSY